MIQNRINWVGYILAATLGAAAGGLVVIYATHALPKLMQGMMQQMMACMKECGCGLEMCREMMQTKQG